MMPMRERERGGGEGGGVTEPDIFTLQVDINELPTGTTRANLVSREVPRVPTVRIGLTRSSTKGGIDLMENPQPHSRSLSIVGGHATSCLSVLGGRRGYPTQR